MDSGTLLSGRYRLDRPIDSGAMGAVWRARDERLDRDVAVKVLLPGLDGAGERFEREAKTLASLKGPNYVEVYDFGEELDGDRTVHYLVMELVEGVSLARLLAREERLDADRAMRIVAEAADALGAAHRRGIVHRDVKPANLLIDADDRVRVVDFGISLLVDRSRLTDSKEVLGTVPYVSPERLRNQDVTGSSDLYSLGAVAYECLTGAPPFPAQDPMAVIHSHLYEEPPPLPETVPPPVASVVSRSLRKDPAERWESGEVLAEACRLAATGEIAVPPPAPAAPAAVPDGERPRSRKRLALLTIATVLAAAVLGVVVWSPWTGDGPLGPGAGEESSLADADEAAGEPTATGTGSPSASAFETESPAAEESESAAEGGSEGGGSEGDAEETHGGEEEQEQPDEPKSGTTELPRVTGMTTFEARDYLEGEGFSNVVPDVGYYMISPEPAHCAVVQQFPSAGSTVDYADQVTLSYHSRNAEGTTCEW
ncbi:serine/threonine protein kinase [Glycomyces sambucus]|uniref:non-specific serine/threonine protein kinase n=1 Tax=Glycomyces sambucus TaxID=380244 RepID=A0A1G9DB76_9ACTN|nr:serine/threonine protein kinase [Glycomyces sambucus]SDK61065.1 serine/threonine protein kinase [Glycomyces sambucus]